MKKRDVEVGGVYAVKVSGKVAPVKLIRESEGFGGFKNGVRHTRTIWYGRNLNTGREITIRSAAKLRRRLDVTAKQWEAVRRPEVSDALVVAANTSPKTDAMSVLAAFLS